MTSWVLKNGKKERDQKKECRGKMRTKMWIVKRGNKRIYEDQEHKILLSHHYSCVNSYVGVDSSMNCFKERGHDMTTKTYLKKKKKMKT
jgi:hypothetical protein